MKATQRKFSRFLGSVLFCFVAAANGATYYIDKGSAASSDSNLGTETAPWKTITKANQSLRPGDTVLIKAGSYNNAISPSVTANSSALITYARFGTDIVTVTGTSTGIGMSGKNFINISGINFINNGSFFDFTSCNDCVISNCTFRGMSGQNNWSGGKLISSCQRNKIVNCTLERWGYFTSNDDIGDLLDFGDETDTRDFTWYNIIEGCKISAGAHSLLNLRTGRTIVRNNYFHNEIWTNGFGGRCIISDAPVETGGWNLFESNRIAFAAAASDATAGAGINLRTRNSIVRFNSFYNNTDAAVFMDGGDLTEDYALWNHVYGNTFYKNGLNSSDSEASIGLQNYGSSYQVKSNSFINNIMRGAKQVFFVNGSGVSLAGQTIAGNWQEAGDPLFVDVTTSYGPSNESLPDFHLKSTSPCIDKGVFLTTVTSPSGSGTSFTVKDAAFFQDGWGGIAADVIQLQGQTNKARITSIDYSKNTISFDSSLSWTSGIGVSSPYSGSAPDQGAFEYGSAGGVPQNRSPVVSAGNNQTVGFPTNQVNLSGTATDPEGDPMTFLWTQVSGPAPGSFSANTISNASFAVNVRGTYLLRLTVSDGRTSSSAEVTLAFAPDPAALAFEAENGALSSPFRVENGYILQDAETTETSGGRATYSFTLPSPGQFTISGLVNAPDESANSYYITIDAEPVEPTNVWDIPVTSGFETKVVSWRGAGTPTANEFSPKVFTLAAGPHTLIIRGREARVEFDRFELVRVSSKPAPPINLRIVETP